MAVDARARNITSIASAGFGCFDVGAVLLDGNPLQSLPGGAAFPSIGFVSLVNCTIAVLQTNAFTGYSGHVDLV
jgi:hypothetical protein